jgi:hypothetical protein
MTTLQKALIPWDSGEKTSVTVRNTTFDGTIIKMPVPVIWPNDVSTGAVDYRAFTSGIQPQRIRCWVDVPFVAAPVVRFKPARAGLPGGVINCTLGRGVPYQVRPLEDFANRNRGRLVFGPQCGISNWELLKRFESEDCHNFVMFARENAKNDPVFIFWPGGGGDVGAAQEPLQWAARLALEGMVVIIANYRRGFLGNFYHPDYAAEADWDGPNFQLSDQRAMVDWARDHIVNFGGDPDNITLAGSSFGGGSVMTLANDPAMSGKYHKLCVISGAGGGERVPRGPKARRGGSQQSRKGYGALCDLRAQWVDAYSASTRSIDTRYRTVKEAINALGIAGAMRYAVPPDFFNEVNNGDNIFSWRDSIHVRERNNIAAIEGGSIPVNVPMLQWTCLDEYSVLGGALIDRTNYAHLVGYDTWQQVTEQPYYSAYNSAVTDKGNIGDLGTANPEYVTDMMIYGAALYWAPMWRIAKARHDQGAFISIIMDNYMSQGSLTSKFVPHTQTDQYLFGGHQIEWKVAYSTEADPPVPRVFARDVFYSEGLVRALKNFVYRGSPGPVLGLNYQLQETIPRFFFGTFNPELRNWSVGGSSVLDARNAPAQMVNRQDPFGSWWMDWVIDWADRLETL